MEKDARMLTLADVQAMSKEASEKSHNRPDFEIYTLGDYLFACEYFPVSAANYRAKHPDIAQIDTTWADELATNIKAMMDAFVQTLSPKQRLITYLVQGKNLADLSKSDAEQLIGLATDILKQAETNKANAKKPRKPTAKGLETTEDIANQVRRDYTLLLNTRKGVRKKVLHAELAEKYNRSTGTIRSYLANAISGASS